MSSPTPAEPSDPLSTVVLRGSQRAVAYARLATGAEPARDFYEALPEEVQVRFDVLLHL